MSTSEEAVSSLVMVSGDDIPSGVNFQSSDRLDRSRETFRGFLKVTSTMMGSEETVQY